jgi:pimeloyl-ACP methyl ester carboxylesterase
MNSALPCLVMIPGTLCDARVFNRQKRALRGIAHLTVVDYRSLTDMDTWAELLLRKLPAQFSVAGFSLGGLWALELLRRAPERIERIALIASNAQGAGVAAGRNSARLRKLWRARGPGDLARNMQPAYFHHARVQRQHAALVRDMALCTPRKAAFAEFAWAAARPDGHAALAQFERPLLLVSGAKDRICPTSWQRAIQTAQPHAVWRDLPRVGHFVPLEAPVPLNDALRKWMQCIVS